MKTPHGELCISTKNRMCVGRYQRSDLLPQQLEGFGPLKQNGASKGIRSCGHTCGTFSSVNTEGSQPNAQTLLYQTQTRLSDTDAVLRDFRKPAKIENDRNTDAIRDIADASEIQKRDPNTRRCGKNLKYRRNRPICNFKNANSATKMLNAKGQESHRACQNVYGNLRISFSFAWT
ncbi:hypothetical protein SUGI_0701370 [Cryptomeria japonica]|nr:hypothetical protein SUGI_0701370 [Cryptomeria japonica]